MHGSMQNVAPVINQAHRGGMLRLAFLSAVVSLVVSFAAAAAPIPLYNIYRAEDGFTNAGISMAVVAYAVGTINAVIECILSRSAAKYYGPAATLSDDQIRELVRIGTTAPTSFHLQNWRFIAVRTPEAKGHATDPKRDAAIQFARKVIETRGKVSDADLKAVRDAGYTDANVMEIVALAAMYSLTNFIDNVFDPEKDFPTVKPAGSI